MRCEGVVSVFSIEADDAYSSSVAALYVEHTEAVSRKIIGDPPSLEPSLCLL